MHVRVVRYTCTHINNEIGSVYTNTARIGSSEWHLFQTGPREHPYFTDTCVHAHVPRTHNRGDRRVEKGPGYLKFAIIIDRTDSYPNNFTYAASANLELRAGRTSRDLNVRYIGRINTSHFSFSFFFIGLNLF